MSNIKQGARPKVRKSRAVGVVLTPKAEKYLERRPYAPGQHGRQQKQPSDYKVRLLEKQKLRFAADLTERSMLRYYVQARRLGGRTGLNLLTLVVSRLDMVLFHAGFARSIYQAKQMVGHKHLLVNGVLVNIPSYQVRPGDCIQVKDKSTTLEPMQIAAAGGNLAGRTPPSYLDSQLEKLEIRYLRAPEQRSEIPVECDEQLVVEFYARG